MSFSIHHESVWLMSLAEHVKCTKANGGNPISLGTQSYESYFGSHAIQENAFEAMIMIIHFMIY